MIFQRPGQPPMEFPMESDVRDQSSTKEELDKWHKVGAETITVPAGTFLCDHWAKDDGKGDVWASSKISPLAMVKEVTATESMTLVKLITDAKDHITGTPTKFDPQAMRRKAQQP
jgi:hypothetical protein